MKLIVSLVLVVAAQTNPTPQFGYPYPNYYRPPPQSQPQIIGGSYTFIDPSGVKRTVEFTSDGPNGFNAVVQEPPKKDPPEQKDGNQTTTAAPDARNDTKKPEPKIQYVPVPVYPPNVASRSFASPYSPYGSYPYRGFGFQGPYG